LAYGRGPEEDGKRKRMDGNEERERRVGMSWHVPLLPVLHHDELPIDLARASLLALFFHAKGTGASVSMIFRG
jgi:hypothetical protein